MSYFYSVFGLRVRSNRPVPVFLPAAPGQPDVRLHLEGARPHPFGSLSREEWYQCPDADSRGQPLLRGWKLGGGEYFHFHFSEGPEFFFDRRGESAWSFWPPGLSFDNLLTFLAGPAFGCLLFLRGMTVLHGSAIAIGDKAIALLGPGGAGKSTTAAAFALSNFPVLTDDIVAIAERRGEFLVQPAYRRVCLWPDSVAALYGSVNALPLITAGWEKRGLELGDRGPFQPHAVPLAAIYVLGERTSPLPAGIIAPLAPRELLVKLLGNTYAGRLPNDHRAHEFDVLARLVNRVHGRRVTPNPSPTHIARLCNAIIEDFERLDCRAEKTAYV
ncbi:MAG: hypothetical protein WA463_12305 [Terriglobales bacterium]